MSIIPPVSLRVATKHHQGQLYIGLITVTSYFCSVDSPVAHATEYQGVLMAGGSEQWRQENSSGDLREALRQVDKAIEDATAESRVLPKKKSDDA